MEPRLVAVWTTVATARQAREIADALVEQRLAACVQISAIDSVYAWQGALQHEPEFRLVIKTTPRCREAVEAALRDRHPYEVPAIYTVPLAFVDPPYAEWAEACCAGDDATRPDSGASR